jgi:sugar phosphate isomerase/epimerase
MPAAIELGVCSWSLRPTSPRDLLDKVRACGVSAVQLDLTPLREFRWRVDETVGVLKVGGVRVLSGMIGFKGEDYSTLKSIEATGGVRPDEHWAENLRGAEASAILAARVGLSLVTFHAGFLPHGEGAARAEREKMIDRLRQIIDVFAARNVRVAFETGQESAATLREVLDVIDRPALGVNFDPANMILYGMGDPVTALGELAPRVRQIHIKDARPASTPGEWGTEVRVGTGTVDWPAFFATVRRAGLNVNLLIEREAGEDRIADIRAAAQLVRERAKAELGAALAGATL